MYLGNTITNIAPYERAQKGISRSFQHAGVFHDMTLEENLVLAVEQTKQFPWWWKFSKKYRKESQEIVDAALDDINMLSLKHALAGTLSGGQVRLLELKRLQLTDAKLYLIDEPTAGVSPVMREQLSKSIVNLAKNPEVSVIIVEHDLKFLFGLADRIEVLVDGSNYLSGTPQEVQQDERLKEVYFGSSSSE